VCHALLHDPKFLALLLRIDHELAAQTRAGGCHCGGALHRADYPRKPRGCPVEVRADHSSRLSFCCAVCRRRATSMSVRFLGQRVYLGLAVVLVSAQPVGPTSAAARLGATLGATLGVGRRTLARWRAWWRELFPLTPLWRAGCARFIPPLAEARIPGELIERFTGPPHEALMRLLVWLSPVTIRSGRPVVDRSDPSCVGADLAA
jgi:hypothetical protein